jgi:hypothetical protein
MNQAILDEGIVREVTPRDVAWSERQFDVVMIGRKMQVVYSGRDGRRVRCTARAS